jgi:hypothetical protein
MRAHRKKPCPSSPPCDPASPCHECQYRAKGLLRARQSQERKQKGEAPLLTVAARQSCERHRRSLVDESWAKAQDPDYYRWLRFPQQFSPWVSIMGRMP